MTSFSIPWVTEWPAAAWSALAAWATLLVAAVAALFAWHQVREMRKTRDEQTMPYVVVDFRPSRVGGIFMDLVISNLGSTLATNVQFEFNPPLVTTASRNTGYELGATTLISKGIPNMPPGKEHVMLFDQMADRYQSDLPQQYTADVTFNDSKGRTHRLSYVLDLSIYFGMLKLRELGVHDVAKAVQDIAGDSKRRAQADRVASLISQGIEVADPAGAENPSDHKSSVSVASRVGDVARMIGFDGLGRLTDASDNEVQAWVASAAEPSPTQATQVIDADRVVALARLQWADAVAQQWFASPHHRLDGVTPIEAMARGDVDEVVAAIRADASGAYD